MHIAELNGGFQWGVLLVTDANSSEQIPDWSSRSQRVTTARSALVVRVMPDIEGDVAIHVVNSEDDVEGTRVYSGRLTVPSRILRVQDALGEKSTAVTLDKDDIGIEIYLDEPEWATSVDLLLRE
jgi:hypothetical protein